MPERLFPPQPELTDGMIRLREWSLDDAEAVRFAVQDPDIPRFMGIPPNHTIEGVRRWLESVPADLESGAGANFAVVDARDGELLGSVGVSRSCDDPEVGEVGYWVSAHVRGQGVASGAIRLLVSWAFEALRLSRIELTTHEDNTASLRVAEKCGFVREGVLRAYREHHGKRVDLVMCAVVRGELQAPSSREAVSRT